MLEWLVRNGICYGSDDDIYSLFFALWNRFGVLGVMMNQKGLGDQFVAANFDPEKCETYSWTLCF